MKKIKFLTFALLLTGVAMMSSCSTEGCTDPDATTYNADADSDDGTCQYEGSVVFWYGEDVSDILVTLGSTSLTYYVDGDIVGTSGTDVYWTGAPDCDQTASITVTKKMGSVKSYTSSYSIVDQDGWEVWDGFINYRANTCEALELD